MVALTRIIVIAFSRLTVSCFELFFKHSQLHSQTDFTAKRIPKERNIHFQISKRRATFHSEEAKYETTVIERLATLSFSNAPNRRREHTFPTFGRIPFFNRRSAHTPSFIFFARYSAEQFFQVTFYHPFGFHSHTKLKVTTQTNTNRRIIKTSFFYLKGEFALFFAFLKNISEFAKEAHAGFCFLFREHPFLQSNGKGSLQKKIL